MSVESEINRLSTAKDDIASAIEDKGVTVPNGTKLDGMPALISQIDGGAGKQDKITASGILKGDGNGGVSAATAGTDYATPGLGLTGASVGDLVRVNSVDSSGKPTSWKHVPLNEIKCNKNLLDNWYFVGGGSQLGDGVFPINQRGQTTYSGSGYGIDRWFGGLSITQAGILFQNVNSWIEQRFRIGSILINQYTYTASALLSDGSLHYGSITCDTSLTAQNFFEDEYIASFAVYPAGRTYHGIGFGTRQTNITIVAVKLELGSKQTLCHNEGTEENPIWVLNEIPDYNEQFEKCLKYLRITSWSTTDCTVGAGYIKGNTIVDAFFDFTMVKNPYISPTNGANWKLVTASGSSITPTSIASWFASSSKVGVRFTIPSTTAHETLYAVPDSGTKVIFSAEL